MLSLLSTLGGLLISGLPKLLEFFQNKADQKHELALARMQTERELALAAQGFAAQQRIEEIRTEQIEIQTEGERVKGAQEHDKVIIEKGSTWVVNYIGTVRPTVTYLFIIELILINAALTAYVWMHPDLVNSMDDLIRVTSVIFTEDEMAMLGGIIGFWFGSRQWSKK